MPRRSQNSSSAQVIYHDPSGFRAQPPFPTVEHPTAVSAAGYMSEYNFNPTHGADLAGPYLAFSNDKAVSLVGGLDYSSSSERTDISLGSGVIGTAPFDVDGDRLVDLVAATPSGVLVRRNAFVLKPTVWDVLTGATTADGEMDLSAGYFAFPQPAVRLQRAAPGSATFVNTAGLTTQWYPAAARIGIGADRSIGLDEAGARYRLVLTNAVGMVHSAPLTVSWTTINSVTTITSGGVRYLDVHYTVRPATVDPGLTVRVVSSTDGVCSATVAAGHCTMRYSGAESWVTARFGAPGYFGSTTQKDLP